MNINIKQLVAAGLTVVALALGVAGSASALSITEGADAAKGDDQSGCLFSNQEGCEGQTPIFQTITNVLLFVIGAVSVIMLIIGGIRYTVSQGDSSAVTSAKNTILYSIIGIVVAILAYAAVNFVIGNFVGGGGESTTSASVNLV